MTNMKPAGLVLLALCSLAVLAAFAFSMVVVIAGPAWENDSPWLLGLHFGATAVNVVLIVIYGVLIYRDDAVRQHRARWLVLLLFFGQATALVYWFRHLRTRVGERQPV
jgi:hypothetical protein